MAIFHYSFILNYMVFNRTISLSICQGQVVRVIWLSLNLQSFAQNLSNHSIISKSHWYPITFHRPLC